MQLIFLKPGPTLAVGHFPLNMTVASNGKIGVVDTTADGEIAVVHLTQMKITRKIKTDEWPHGLGPSSCGGSMGVLPPVDHSPKRMLIPFSIAD